MGIKETMEVVGLVKSIAASIKDARSDGKLDIFDAMKALTLAPDIVSAINGSDQIKLEMDDMTGEEKEALMNEFKDAIFKLVEALI